MSDFNPDVPSSSQIPGTMLSISTAPTSTDTEQPKNLFLLATAILQGSAITGAPYNLTAGTAAPNDIAQYSDVNRVNLAFNRRSPIAKRFRSALQEVPFGINIFPASIREPSNSGFAGFATKVITAAGTAVGSGEISVRVCGLEGFVPVANGDQAAAFAAALRTAIDKLLDAPMVTAPLIGSTTVPLTYVVRGEVGNDSPIVVRIPPEITGLTLSPGAITITTNALGSLFTITVGSLAVVTSIPVGSTPAQSAALIEASVNAATFPLTAKAAAGVLTLFFRSGWVFNRLQIASTEDAAGQVYSLAAGHNSAGALTTVATVPGNPVPTALQGAGVPNLSQVLDNKAKLPAMIEWASDFTDLTSINAEVAHVELFGNGYYQQGQRTTRCSTRSVDDVALLVTGASPALTNYWRHSILTYQDPPCQGGDYAVQTAARLAASDLPFNFDGFVLQSGTDAPLLPARPDTEFNPPTEDVALGSYLLTPLKGVNGLITIVRGKTTWGGSGRWGDWSYGRIFDRVRFELVAFLNSRFTGRVLFTHTTNIRVIRGFTLRDVRNAIGEYLDEQDGVIIDGSLTLKQLIIVQIDRVDSSRIYMQIAVRPPKENHQRIGQLVQAPN